MYSLVWKAVSSKQQQRSARRRTLCRSSTRRAKGILGLGGERGMVAAGVNDHHRACVRALDGGGASPNITQTNI